MNDRFTKHSGNWKRLLALTLAACLALSGTPAAAFAEAEPTAAPDSGLSEVLEEAPIEEAPLAEESPGVETSDEAPSSEESSSEESSSEASSSEASSSEESSSEASSSEASSSEALAPGCACGAEPDAEGNFLHTEGCPLYEAPAPEEPPQAAASAAELLAALPEPGTLGGRAENAPAGEISAAREALDALSNEERRALDPTLMEKLEALEHIRDTLYDCLDFSCPWHYPPEAREQAEAPAPLTLADLVEDYGVTPPMSHYLRSAAPTHPRTLVVKTDNENNMHTGAADGDLGQWLTYIDWRSPIELRFDIPESALPNRSAYLAVNALGVDEERGEDHHVFVNGAELRTLSGDGNNWNTTVLELPLGLLREGANYMEVRPSEDMIENIVYSAPKWTVRVGWMQLILDGGSAAPAGALKLTLGDPLTTSNSLQIPVTAKITPENSGAVEYSLLNESGQNLSAVFGKTASEETVLLNAPKTDGVYTVLGVLKGSGQTILSTDRVTFRIKNGAVVAGPKLIYSLNPDTLTNENVTVALSVEADERYPGVTFWKGGAQLEGGTFTADTNGNYTITMKWGENRSCEEIVPVLNIDRIPPEIAYTGSADPTVDPILTLPAGSTKETAEAAIRQVIQATDELGTATQSPRPVPFTIDIPDEVLKRGGDVTITATDAAGNSAEKAFRVGAVVLPLTITMKDATQQQAAADRFTLTATLDSAGPDDIPITEVGFVWGATQSPTLEVCNGMAKVTPMPAEGKTFSAEAAGIVPGVAYYARAYAKTSGSVHYSGQISFSNGNAPKYGIFSVASNGGGTFTITRADGSDGEQIVYFRTVNGSAIGGTHFDHRADSVTFAAGVIEQTVTINEHGADAVYGGHAATAYSNAARTYQLELYRVKGGGTIGTRFATRTMVGNKEVSRGIYANWTSSSLGASNQIFSTASTNYEDYSTLAMAAPFANLSPYADYLKGTSAQCALSLDMEVVNNGTTKQYLRFTADAGKSIELQFNIDSNATGANYLQTQIPVGGGGISGSCSPNGGDLKLSGDGKSILFPVDTSSIKLDWKCDRRYNYNMWFFKNPVQNYRAEDSREPQILGVAPMAGGTYLPGDPITVAIVFDEIVDSVNSAAAGGLAGVSINTQLCGQMKYAGGADTNVLYFTGTVPTSTTYDPKNFLIWGFYGGSGNVKDLCPTSGTETGTRCDKYIGVAADFSKPTAAITAQSSGELPRHSATVSATGAETLQYTWTRDTDLPASGWLDTTSDATVTARQADGRWYLHLLATSPSGVTAHTSQAFTFKSPALAVSVSDPDAWKREKTITISPSNTAGDINIAMEGPETGAFTGSATRKVTKNGDYTFTLTDSHDTVLTQRLTVKNIDPTPPAVALSESGNTGAVYHSLDFSAAVSDEGGSGLATVEYQWTGGTSTPTTGWSTVSPSTDERYQMTYTAITETTPTKKHLHIRATDRAGNVTDICSQGYQVVKDPGAEGKPAITLTGAPTSWTKGPVNLSWKVINSGVGNFVVTLPDGTYSTEDNGTLPAESNGLYAVRMTDSNGQSAHNSLSVTNIDAEAPVLDGLVVSPADWAQSKTVTLSGVSDNHTPLVDADGNVTGYGGSGVAKREWKLSGSWTEFSGDSFTVSANGTYTVRLTDLVGNVNEYTVAVDGIDGAAPVVKVSGVAGSWTPEAQHLTVEYTDNVSGVKSAQYAIVDSTETKPTEGLIDLPNSGNAVEVSLDGTHYLYYKVTDHAGNVAEGFSGAVKVDAEEPSLSVTGGATGAASLALTVGSSFGHSGGGVTVQKGSEPSVPVPGDTFAVTEKGVYTFTATSKAGKTASQTVSVHEITFAPVGGTSATRQLVVNGGKAAKPRDPARMGYTFQNWQKDGTDYDFNTQVTDDLALTASWSLDAPTVQVSATPENAAGTYAGGSTVVTLTASPSHVAEGVTYAYQWYKDGAEVQGADGSKLALKTVTESGGYTVKVKASVGVLTSAETESTPVTVAIGKATPTVSEAPAASGITYGQALKDSALTGGEASVPGSFAWTLGETAPSVVNSEKTAYSVTFTPADGSNYTTAATEVKLAVARKTLAPSVATVEDKIYDGKTDAAGTLALTGAVFGEQPTASGTFAFTSPPAGQNKPVNVTGITLEGDWGANYALSTTALSNVETGAEVSPKVIGLSWSGFADLVYTGKPMKVTATATGLVEPDACAVTVEGGTETDAGSHTARAAALDNHNYKLPAAVTQDYTIAKAPVSFTVTENAHTYDKAAKVAKVAQTAEETPRIAAEGFAVAYRPKDDPEAQSTPEVTDAGAYDILVTLIDGNFRHTAEASAATRIHRVGELVIEPWGITATWGNLVHVYDGELKAPTLSLEGILDGDDCGYQIKGGGRTDAGVSPVSAELTGEDAHNYQLLNPSAALTVQKAPVTFTVTGNTVPADGNPHAATITPNPGNVLFTVAYRQNGEPVENPTEPGTYEIWAGITGKNHRHSGAADSAPRRIGVLTLYRETPPPLYTAAFEGGEEAEGGAPTMPPSPAGAVLYLPENPFTRADHAFTGWELDGKLYQPGDAFPMPGRNVTFAAQWEKTVHDVGGMVKQDGTPVGGALVTLMRGARQMAETTTDIQGKYSFTGLTPGLYNLVASKSGTVMTIKVEIVTSDVENADITLPRGMTNSVVEVAAGTPPIVVGNLEQTFDEVDGAVYTAEDAATVAAGGTVEIKFTAEEQPPQDAGDAAQIEAEKAGSDHVALLLELTLEKTVTSVSGDVEKTDLHESNVLLEAVLFLPAELQGKYSYTVYRVHGGEVQALTEQKNEYGEFIELDEARKKLTLHAKLFSTYAVAYADRPRFSGGSGDSGGSSFFRPGEYDFWEQVREKILDAKPGDTVKAYARGFDRMPEKVMAALRERDRVSLEISWTGGEAFTIPAGQALEPDGLRVYYMLGYLEELYHARPSAAGDKTNPETGGVWEITAPEPAANTAPPAFTAEDAGLAAAPEQAREPGEQAEKAAFTPAAPDAAAGGTAENSIAWLAALLLLAIAVGGIWYWKHRKA